MESSTVRTRRLPIAKVHCDPVSKGERMRDVVDSAASGFRAYSVDDQLRIAEGIVARELQPGRRGILSYEPSSGWLRIDVSIGHIGDSRAIRPLAHLLDLAGRSQATRIWRDRETGEVWARSATFCETLTSGGPALRAIAIDLRRTLQDEAVALAFSSPGLERCTG